MSEMIERVAMAVADAMNKHGPVASGYVARAAIEAMREPTHGMALEGGCHLPNSENATPSELAEDASKVWIAMIAEALEAK